MAKVTPPQEIPSELLDGYRGTLGEKRPDNGVRKRVPYRIPTIQTLVGHPSAAQKTQRARFLIAEGNFANVDPATRQRWYAAMPPWSSFLWYYNYFIMSSLAGNADISEGGAGLIKTIQHVSGTLLAGAPANVNIVITEVDPDKSVVMLFGAGYNKLYAGDPEFGFAWSVYPYIVSVAAELVVVKASATIEENAGISITVIEYI